MEVAEEHAPEILHKVLQVFVFEDTVNEAGEVTDAKYLGGFRVSDQEQKDELLRIGSENAENILIRRRNS